MKKTTIAILVTLGLGTATLLACPAGGNDQRGGAHKNGMQKIMKQLDPSDEQRAQLQTLKESRQNMMQAKRTSCKENRKSMRGQMKPDMTKFMTANTFDKDAFKQEMHKKFEAKRAMMENKKTTMMEYRANNMEKMFNILTPEQRIKWIELSKNQTVKKQKNKQQQKNKGKSDHIVIKGKPHISAVIHKAENIEITQPDPAGGDNHKGPGQEPGIKISIA